MCNGGHRNTADIERLKLQNQDILSTLDIFGFPLNSNNYPKKFL
jgi:hypothetical protein